jgi:hypothetical protein
VKSVIELQDAAAERDQKKQQLLDDIASLRNEMVRLRIEMQRDIGLRQFDDANWQQRLALRWQIFYPDWKLGFTNQFFRDSWVVGLLEGRPWWVRHRIGKAILKAG